MAWQSIYGIFLHCSGLVSALAKLGPPTLLTTTNRNFSLTLFTSSESVIALEKGGAILLNLSIRLLTIYILDRKR